MNARWSDVHSHALEQARRRVGQAWGQGGKDPVRGLDQGDPDVLAGVDPVQPVGHDLTGGAVQFGRELGAGGAGADDRDVELAGSHRLQLACGHADRR